MKRRQASNSLTIFLWGKSRNHLLEESLRYYGLLPKLRDDIEQMQKHIFYRGTNSIIDPGLGDDDDTDNDTDDSDDG